MSSQVTIVVTGNLGKDARMQYTKEGTPMLNFSVAGRAGYGQREEAVWLSCTLFGKRAEGELVNYLKKGTAVQVTGFISSAVNKDNPWLNVNVSDVSFVGGRSDSAATETEAEAETQQADDIPF